MRRFLTLLLSVLMLLTSLPVLAEEAAEAPELSLQAIEGVIRPGKALLLSFTVTPRASKFCPLSRRIP